MRRRRRMLLLGVGLPLYAATLAFVATIAVALLSNPGEILQIIGELFDEPLLLDDLWWAWCGAPALVITATQIVFVVPLVRPKLATKARGRSMRAAVIMAAGVAAVLTAGLFCGLLELLDLWHDRFDQAPWAWPVLLAVIVTGWVIWSVALLMLTRNSRHPGVLEKLVIWLLAGTVVEILAVIPVDVLVRRRTDCYCATGTFHSLLIAVLAALWLAGPGAVILWSRRRRRRAARECLHCGYTKGPSPGPTCPECGHVWDE